MPILWPEDSAYIECGNWAKKSVFSGRNSKEGWGGGIRASGQRDPTRPSGLAGRGSPVEEQGLAVRVAAAQMLRSAALLALLEAAMAGSTERLKLAIPEQVEIASMRGHVVSDIGGLDLACGEPHAAQGFDAL
jgi:hypothetical protein